MEMYQQIFNAVDAGLIALDRELCIVDWNQWMVSRTGFEKEEVLHRSLFELYPEIRAPWFERSFRSVLKFGNYAFYAQKLHGYIIPIPFPVSKPGDTRFMQQNCTLGPLRDTKGVISGLFLMIQDVTEVAEYERRLSKAAKIDGLTGVHNRSAFESQLSTELHRKQRYYNELSLVLLDIDHFKAVNDTYGHQKGDEVLQDVSRLVTASLRATDFLARYGGEEFAVILPQTDLASANRIAERTRKLIEATVFNHDCRGFQVTVSLGVATWCPSMQSAEALIAAADRALYQAKSAGRNRVWVSGGEEG